VDDGQQLASMGNSTPRFHIVSLGCAKNTVDSESMAALLGPAGYSRVDEHEQAEIIVVNTCGFINAAKEESLAVLTDLAEKKSQGQILIAAGCLSQRYGDALIQEIPGIDGVIGTRRWMDIVPFVKRLRDRKKPMPLYHLPESAVAVGTDEQGVLRAAIQGASAYLKIADGCRRPCAFCAIPQIKGTLVSRPVARIVDEARALRDTGVKELIRTRPTTVTIWG